MDVAAYRARTIRQFRIALAPAVVALGLGGWWVVRFPADETTEAKDISKIEQEALRRWPFRTMSKLAAAAMELELPKGQRETMFKQFCSVNGCNPADAEKPLVEYLSLSDFFARKWKDGLRPISKEGLLVAPSDGTIVSLGSVAQNGTIEQVKGSSFSVRDLLCADEEDPVTSSAVNVGEGSAGRVQADKLALHYVNIYLNPGDFHRFVSPCEWDVRRRRHYVGNLLPVKTNVLTKVPHVLDQNERVVLSGKWNHGNIYMVAVGATAVGSIKVDFDDELETNKRSDWKGTVKASHYMTEEHRKGIKLERGDPVGSFRSGSTIVLVFEAPENFMFDFKVGDKIENGQSLGSCPKK